MGLLSCITDTSPLYTPDCALDISIEKYVFSVSGDTLLNNRINNVFTDFICEDGYYLGVAATDNGQRANVWRQLVSGYH
ncbi:MAG: hypothetical protein GF313_16610 [Caldithrix sp.]|nr:hypothetical protein [Caldithrix sp.]